MSFNILNVSDSVYSDTSISNYQFHTHQPYAATTFNNNDEIRIPIQTQDLYTLPGQSFLYIEGKVTNGKNEASKHVSLINNGIAYLFDEIRYELGGVVVDRTRNPGITSTIKGYVSYTSNEIKRLENAGWKLNENPNLLDDKGTFNICLPLRTLLGLCEDFQKIVMNVNQELVLIRSNSDTNAIIQISQPEQAEEYKVVLSKILWKIPHVSVSDVEKLRLLKHLENGRDLSMPFRSWELHEYPVLQETTAHTWAVKSTALIARPRFLIFTLSTDRKNNISKNMSVFDHGNLSNFKLYLNSDAYPYDNLNLNFDTKQWALLYEMYAQFQKSFYYRQHGEPCYEPIKFHGVCPFVVVDCSHQNETLKTGAIDIRVEFETTKNIPANTTAYCLILYDRLVKYNPLSNIVKSIS